MGKGSGIRRANALDNGVGPVDGQRAGAQEGSSALGISPLSVLYSFSISLSSNYIRLYMIFHFLIPKNLFSRSGIEGVETARAAPECLSRGVGGWFSRVHSFRESFQRNVPGVSPERFIPHFWHTRCDAGLSLSVSATTARTPGCQSAHAESAATASVM